MERYYALIEFIKTEYLDNAHLNIEEEIPDVVKNIKDEFDIKVCQYDGIQYRHVKQYEIKEKSDGKIWNIIVGPASLLYAASLEKYRYEIINENTVRGIFTLKNTFFRSSTIPTAVIILGESKEDIWLTSAMTNEDVVALMTDIKNYGRKVYYTSKLDTKNFMPEYYNGELNEVSSELDKYETKELQEIAEIINGKNAKPYQLAAEGIPYLRGRNLQHGKIVDVNDFVVAEAAEEFSKQLLEEGDILLQKQFGYHKIARVTADDLPAIASSGLFIIRSFGVPEDYLYTYLSSETGHATFEKQLKSIERGATIVSIALADLKSLRVPIYDKETMQGFSQIETVKAEDIASVMTQNSRLMAYFTAMNRANNKFVEVDVISALCKASWNVNDVRLTRKQGFEPPKGLHIDILLYDNDSMIAAMVIKEDLSQVTPEWLSQAKQLVEDRDIPVAILVLGNYYEIHVSKNGKVLKQNVPPTKEQLLSLINGKEEN